MNPEALGVSPEDLEWAREYVRKHSTKAPTQAPVPTPPTPPNQDLVEKLFAQLQAQSEYVKNLADWTLEMRQQQATERAEVTRYLEETREVLAAVLDRITAPATPTVPPDDHKEQDHADD